LRLLFYASTFRNLEVLLSTRILGVIALFTLVGCGSASEDFGSTEPTPDRSLELTPQQRADRLPNALFHAVWNNNAAEIEKAGSIPELTTAMNDEGDTPLGMALRMGHRASAEHLLRLTVTSMQDLKHLNKAQESYVFLAARSGFADLITMMADAYFNSLGRMLTYEFSDLDQPNAKGQRALFVAANRRVVEALEVQYYRGTMTYPFWKFTLQTDEKERTFLHQAAADGRDDVILWAADRFCSAGSWEKSDSFWKYIPGTLATYLWRSLQTHVVGDFNSPFDLVFNRPDNDYLTPLHVAVEQKRWGALRALSHCRWVDFDLKDSHGDTPLHSFLKTLNPFSWRRTRACV
jgi:ankyrin repeat protein